MRRNAVPAIVLLVVLSALPAVAATPLWREGVSLIPYPQEAVLGGEDFVIEGPLAIVPEGNASAADRFAAQDLAERLKTDHGIEAVVGDRAGKRIVLSRQGAPERIGDQGYLLETSKDQLTIRARGEAGLFYGTRTVLQSIVPGRGGKKIPAMRLTDWPDIPQRAAHYDTKHHQDQAEYVRAFIRDLADYKLNMLLWEWEDKFAYERHPEIGAPGAFTKAEMQEFTRYARRYHVQIVPLVQGLGHVSFILKWPQHSRLARDSRLQLGVLPAQGGLLRAAVRPLGGGDGGHSRARSSSTSAPMRPTSWARAWRAAAGITPRSIGRRALMKVFVDRAFEHLTKTSGRRVMCWGLEYIPSGQTRPLGDDADQDQPPHPSGDQVQPPRGLIAAEFGPDPDIARASRDAGYPAWVYDPNPGIEHLFLPYLYRRRGEGNEQGVRRPGELLQHGFGRRPLRAVRGDGQHLLG